MLVRRADKCLFKPYRVLRSAECPIITDPSSAGCCRGCTFSHRNSVSEIWFFVHWLVVIVAYLCLATLHAWTHAYDALCLIMDRKARKPMASWRRPPGRPRNIWLHKVQEDVNALVLSTLWRSEIARGHGAAQRSIPTTQRRS